MFCLFFRKLTADMETTKVALENERKIQQLQMQAINALWKKVSTMQPSQQMLSNDVLGAGQIPDNHSQAIVQDLAKTCTVLTNQVQQLQGSMHDILQCMTVFCKLPQQSEAIPSKTTTTTSTQSADSCSTQTDIVAVRTPQVDNPPFPFSPNTKLQRPSTLPLDAKLHTVTHSAQLADEHIPRTMDTFSKDEVSVGDAVSEGSQSLLELHHLEQKFASVVNATDTE